MTTEEREIWCATYACAAVQQITSGYAPSFELAADFADRAIDGLRKIRASHPETGLAVPRS